MTAPRKLAAFLAGLLVTFGLGHGVGAFFDLESDVSPPAHHGVDDR